MTSSQVPRRSGPSFSMSTAMHTQGQALRDDPIDVALLRPGLRCMNAALSTEIEMIFRVNSKSLGNLEKW